MRRFWFPAVLLAGASESDPSLEARSSVVESGFELRICGGAGRWPEGARVMLRFRRVVNQLEGQQGDLVTAPEVSSWVRWTTVLRGRFVHREVFPAPGQVLVEVAPEPVATSGPDAILGVFDVAPPWETAQVFRREVQLWQEILSEGSRWGDPGGRGLARRRLAMLRQEEGRYLFTATAAFVERVLEDYWGSIMTVRAGRGPHPGARGLRSEDLSRELEQGRGVFGRERRILAVRLARGLRGMGVEPAMRVLDLLRGAVREDEILWSFLGEISGWVLGSAGAEDAERRIEEFMNRARRGC